MEGRAPTRGCLTLYPNDGAPAFPPACHLYIHSTRMPVCKSCNCGGVVAGF